MVLLESIVAKNGGDRRFVVMGFRLLARGGQLESRFESTERFAAFDKETIIIANVHVAKDSVFICLLHLLQSTSDSILHTNPTRFTHLHSP